MTFLKINNLSIDYKMRKETVNAAKNINIDINKGEIVGLVSTAKTLFYFLPLKFINLLVHTSIYEYSVSYSIKKMQLLKHNFKSQEKTWSLIHFFEKQ